MSSADPAGDEPATAPDAAAVPDDSADPKAGHRTAPVQHNEPSPDPGPDVTPAPTPAPAELSLGERPAPIRSADTFAVAGRKAMWPHVERLLAREGELADPGQVDGLKRYRVATRRLRAALRVFRDAYPGRTTRPIRRELSRLADAVGEVRDLDVRISGVGEWARTQVPDRSEAVAPLSLAWAARRTSSADALLRRVATRHHARLREDLVAFVTDADDKDDDGRGDGPALEDGPARTIRDRAGSETWIAFERVRAYATVVRWADLPTLHQLRIEAKRLRYTIEFLGTQLGPGRTRVLEQLVALQDHLGALNDAAIAADATRAFLAERHASLGPDERSGIEAYLADRERAVRALRRGVGRAWRPITSQLFARRLAGAVAGPASPRPRRPTPPA